jgi:hypothetical protein
MRDHTETAQIIQFSAFRPSRAKRMVRDPYHYPLLNAKKAYPTPPEISASGAIAAPPGWKPMRSWTIGTQQ